MTTTHVGMENITICIRLDTGYRKTVESYGVRFEDYIAGLVAEHFLNGGDWDELQSNLDRRKQAAFVELRNRTGLGIVLQGSLSP